MFPQKSAKIVLCSINTQPSDFGVTVSFMWDEWALDLELSSTFRLHVRLIDSQHSSVMEF